ncbi:4-hydroxy-tetrahydrodipicolinate reductase [Sedimentisphaera salicampi]|uniref:4-hydroxy-tetrahydrodipicolinate reductase n=1 Tax=Sedimentisphaera salicampi TaxID=1941349 RepID=A0A1W6LNL7_9BACT|nr:4-hydroxy-tetrahydrodipicolinate reductase [Sedimentisphaera salicampi]ARN57378.1 4-hydroxy-tetrahydrodipicolinate reductase [Sedimentisphaera salicampi]OXU14584.1 4-hydroxy-tetrahydrodipicolinate reductase [Sedimentisphaera salicampi]
MTKLVINGAAGRMGKRILALAVESGEFDIVGALEHSSSELLGNDAGEAAGIGRIGLPLSSRKPEIADVMIDFTLAPAADETIEYCQNAGIGLVMGTTGLSDEQISKLERAAKDIPVIYGTNMSVGMNFLFEMVGKFAKMLGEKYDIEIIEHHHKFKKDAPSGSATTLAERIAEETGRDMPGSVQHGRQGPDSLRKDGEIGMHAVRGGDIIGFHEVMYSTLGETVTVQHRAHNRDNFVRGAIRAAGWLAGKEPGWYKMKDVLGL